MVRDVSEPRALALPGYRGGLYVYLAIAMGGVFLLTAAPLLAACAVIYVGGQLVDWLAVWLSVCLSVWLAGCHWLQCAELLAGVLAAVC